ncbi:MAG: hypothetical protein J6D27_06990 [Ruminiclostridium sp.]|nr:hypothetical protein [Ruminiclostridium sp.]
MAEISEISEILGDDEVLFSFRSEFSEAEYKRIVYRTRERERRIRSIFMGIAAILCVVIGLCTDKTRMVGFAAFMVICIAYNYIQPLIVTNKHIKSLREKYGTAEHITSCYFIDDGAKVIYEERGIAIYPKYEQLTRLYIKDSWLFFCAENLLGFYVKRSDEIDVDNITSFMKEKNPTIKILR